MTHSVLAKLSTRYWCIASFNRYADINFLLIRRLLHARAEGIERSAGPARKNKSKRVALLAREPLIKSHAVATVLSGFRQEGPI